MMPVGGHELRVGERLRCELALAGPRDPRRFETHPPAARAQAAHDLELSGLAESDLDARVDVGGSYLGAGLVAVTPVGDENQIVAAQHGHAGRPAETREPAHVGQRRDDEHVAAVVGERGPHAPGPTADVHRRKARHHDVPSSRPTAWNARS